MSAGDQEQSGLIEPPAQLYDSRAGENTAVAGTVDRDDAQSIVQCIVFFLKICDPCSVRTPERGTYSTIDTAEPTDSTS